MDDQKLTLVDLKFRANALNKLFNNHKFTKDKCDCRNNLRHHKLEMRYNGMIQKFSP